MPAFAEICPVPVHVDWLPYSEALEARDKASIRTVVIHCTELPDLAMAREYGEEVRYPETGTGNCGHFYIDRDGRLEQWVPLSRVAHHVADHNQDSLGIELVNRGRYPKWWHSDHQAMPEPYATDQIRALQALIAALEDHLLGLETITGHEDLDTRRVPATDNPELEVDRKRDPGPGFPWKALMAGTRLERFIRPDRVASGT